MGCIYSVHASEQGVQTWLQEQAAACQSKGVGVSPDPHHTDAGPPKVERKALKVGPGSPQPEHAESGVRRLVIPVGGPAPTRESAPGLKDEVSGRIPIDAPFRIPKKKTRSWIIFDGERSEVCAT